MSMGTNQDDVPIVLYEPLNITEADVRSRQSTYKSVSFLRIISESVSFSLIFLTWLILKYLVKPIRRPFLCSDLNLYHPEPIKNGFPTWILFVCAVILPIIIILLSEGVLWYFVQRKRAAGVVYRIQFRSTIYHVPEWAENLYIVLGMFVFSSCINAFLTSFGKVTIGRHRPHFIPSCFHNYTYHEFCVDATQWIVNYTCIGETSTVVKEKDGVYDIRKSFPSGHASIAFCGLIFLAIAAYIGITRVTDHRHHATDVFAGAILGTVVAIIAFWYMIRLLRQTVSVDDRNDVRRGGADLDSTL